MSVGAIICIAWDSFKDCLIIFITTLPKHFYNLSDVQEQGRPAPQSYVSIPVNALKKHPLLKPDLPS